VVGNGSELRTLAGYMSCAERSGYACGMSNDLVWSLHRMMRLLPYLWVG